MTPDSSQVLMALSLSHSLLSAAFALRFSSASFREQALATARGGPSSAFLAGSTILSEKTRSSIGLKLEGCAAEVFVGSDSYPKSCGCHYQEAFVEHG
eukprot:12918932-Prorocentrum_lima.AAC.1